MSELDALAVGLGRGAGRGVGVGAGVGAVAPERGGAVALGVPEGAGLSGLEDAAGALDGACAAEGVVGVVGRSVSPLEP